MTINRLAAEWPLLVAAMIAVLGLSIEHEIIGAGQLASLVAAFAVLGLIILVPALFPPWQIGRNMVATGFYPAALGVVAFLEAHRRHRLTKMVARLALLSFAAIVIAGGLGSQRSGYLAAGVGLGLLLALIGCAHWLVLNRRLSGA